MWQELVNAAVEVGRQALQDIAQVGPGVVPVELGGLNQAHNHRRTLPGELAAGEQPSLSSDRPRADLVFKVVVIECDVPVVEEA